MKFNYTIFSTTHHDYLYDGTSCNIFLITPTLKANHRAAFKAYMEGSLVPALLIGDVRDISEAHQTGALLSGSDMPAEYWFDETEYRNSLHDTMHHLMIGVTEQCNMRCRYCVYGGHYPFERVHGDHVMSWDNMKKSIDFFWENSRSKRKIVNFYGGEPFLSFDRIRKAVDYIHSLTPSEDVMVYITTNGTLLNSQVAEWFISHREVNLFVSLAGNPQHHDRLRVFQNGAPSYKHIQENMLRIRQKSEEQYVQRVNFVFNIFDEIQLKEVMDFVKKDEMFRGLKHIPEVTFIDCVADDGTIYKLRNHILKDCDRDYQPLQEYIRCLLAGERENLLVKVTPHKEKI